MKEGAVMARLLARLGDQIMRYFNVLERLPNSPIRRNRTPLLIALLAKLC
jgi:hypothetical protein